NDGRLLCEKFAPTETYVLKPLLQRVPHALLPTQAALDSVAILHQRFFDFLAHFARMRRAEDGHLSIPTRAEFLAKALQAEELPQGLKMFGRARASAIDFCYIEELAPRFASEQSDGAQFAAALEMSKDFASNVFLIFCGNVARSFRTIFNERLLRVRRFAMNTPHEADQLIPRLAMHVPVSARIHRSQFPFVL